jgi:hypothetical protein
MYFSSSLFARQGRRKVPKEEGNTQLFYTPYGRFLLLGFAQSNSKSVFSLFSLVLSFEVNILASN